MSLLEENVREFTSAPLLQEKYIGLAIVPLNLKDKAFSNLLVAINEE